MKKALFVLAACLLIFAFVACSDDDTGGTGSTGGTGGTGGTVTYPGGVGLSAYIVAYCPVYYSAHAIGEGAWIDIKFVAPASGLPALTEGWRVKMGNSSFLNTLMTSADIAGWQIAAGDVLRIHSHHWTGTKDVAKANNDPNVWDYHTADPNMSKTYGFYFVENADGTPVNAAAFNVGANTSWVTVAPLQALTNIVGKGLWGGDTRTNALQIDDEVNYRAALVNPAAPGLNKTDWTTVEATAALVAAGITTITPPDQDATTLILPKVATGYTIAIKTSSNPGLVATDGTIVPPATATSVDLVLTVTRTADASTADTISIAVLIPAKSPVGSTFMNVLYTFQSSGVNYASNIAPVTLTASVFANTGGTVNYVAGYTTSAYSANTWSTDTTRGNYDAFTVSETGKNISLSTLVFRHYRSSTGPQGWAIRTSADSYTDDVASGTVDAATTWKTETVDLSAIAAQANTLTIRIYGFSAGATTGTWRLDDVRLTGHVITP